MRGRRLAGLGALVMLVVAAVAIAAATGAFRTTAASTAGAGGATNAIKVHGNWTIQVAAHGRILRTVHFHNDFSGAKKLVSLLSRQQSMGQWMIFVGANQMCGPDGGEYCWIDEGIPGTVAQTHTIVVTTPSSGADDGKLVLTATLVPTKDASITQVRASTVECPATTAPASPCHDNGFGSFSQRDLPSAIPVVSGQQVLITVKYTFS